MFTSLVEIPCVSGSSPISDRLSISVPLRDVTAFLSDIVNPTHRPETHSDLLEELAGRFLVSGNPIGFRPFWMTSCILRSMKPIQLLMGPRN
jgi:hypothetical protein